MSCVLIVDDEPGRIEYFRFALEDANYTVVVIPEVAQAIDYLKTPHDDLIAVIMDIQMPPGPLASGDHQDGTATGKLLLKYILDMNYVQKESGHPLPIAVLTHLKDPKIIAAVEETQILKRPKEKFKIWCKFDVSPTDFVGQFETWLQALKDLYGEE